MRKFYVYKCIYYFVYDFDHLISFIKWFTVKLMIYIYIYILKVYVQDTTKKKLIQKNIAISISFWQRFFFKQQF